MERNLVGQFLKRLRPSLPKPRPPLHNNAQIPGTLGHSAAVDTTGMDPAMKEALGLTEKKK